MSAYQQNKAIGFVINKVLNQNKTMEYWFET